MVGELNYKLIAGDSMPLTRVKKQEVISEIASLLDDSKLTVVAKYDGTSVKQMQALRKQAKQNATVVKVVKNRLVIKALNDNDKFKDADKSQLSSQLLYAFNSEDEVAPAQALAAFAKTNPNLKFVGAYTADGHFIEASDVTALANLPSKDQLRAQLAATINAPLNGFVRVMSGNIRGVLNVLNARAESLG
jgi:large subunit ribosomal protein L10